ncbi:MAG: hypothetical protein KBS59_05505 [Clostridiales bacterium]|nr:hypothetical protein [Clostridiales bacterium]
MRKSSLMMGADTPVSYLYGIGEKKSEALARIGIYTLRDLCYHFPRAYENRGKITTVADACDGEVCALLLTVSANPRSAQIRRGMIITKLSAFDETGKCNITFFNAPFVKDVLRQGETFRFYGKVTRKGYTLEMTSPSYEIYREGMTLKNFVPVYPLTAGISQKQMITAVNMALDALLSPSCDDGIRDILPCDVKRDNSLCDIAFALRNIHSPQS